MSAAKHTPTPWKAIPSGFVLAKDRVTIITKPGDTLGCDRANAEHIVRCVNAHDGLTEAAGILRSLIDSPRFQGMSVAEAVSELANNGMDARAALAKVSS